MLSKKSLSNEILIVLNDIFTQSTVNFFLLKKGSLDIEISLSNKTVWPIPEKDIHWLKSSNSKIISDSDVNATFKNGVYIKKRNKFPDLDILQIALDKNKYSYDCSDGLYIKLENKEKELFDITSIL